MNLLVLGVGVGVLLTLFCMFAMDAFRENNKITEAEMEAWQEWQEWQEEREKREKKEQKI